MARSPSKQQAEIFINKIEAARRQIDAAIRMTLTNEDELAIHTVASAGYRIVRDLLEKRGRFDFDELLRHGIFALASDIAHENIENEALNTMFPEGTGFRYKLEEIAAQIKAEGDSFDVGTIRLKASHERKRADYVQINKTYNFLKHADNDDSQLLNLKDVDNDTILVRAIAAYALLMQDNTAEMSVHKLMYFAATSERVDDYDGDDRDLVVALADLSPSKRRKAGQRLLRLFKRWRRDSE